MQVVSQFEACCARLETATEELMAFRRDPHALEWSREVIDRSWMPTARFQAIAAMRDVIMVRWTQLSEEERVGLRDYLFRVASSSSEVVVARRAWAAYADVCARGASSSSRWSGSEAVRQCAKYEDGLRALMAGMTKAKEQWQRDGIAACGRVAFEAFLSNGGACRLAADVVSWDWDGPAPTWWRSHLGTLVEKATGWYREHAAAELRELLVALSSVTASAFGGDLDAFRAYLDIPLASIATCLFTVGLSRSDDVAPDFCGASAATSRCASAGSRFASLLDLLRNATRLVIERGELTGEPMTALLQAWERASSSSSTREDDARLYVEFVTREIQVQRDLAVEEMTVEHDADLDPSDEEDSERYAMASIIGRCDANASAGFLSYRLGLATASFGREASDATLEELRCCVEFATELLTDDEFRYAEVPIALERSGPAVVRLVDCLTQLANKEFLSPPVAASLAHFLSRFTATYLESDFACGEFRNKRMADSVALCAARWLNAFPTEPSVVQRSLRVVAALSASRGGRPLEGVVLGAGGEREGAALMEGWLDALLSARVSALEGRAELYGVCADLCLSKHVFCGGGAEPFEKKIAGQILGTQGDDQAFFVLLGGVARATAAQAVKAPNGTDSRAEEARRAPADLVCRGLVSRSPSSPAALACCRDLAVNQLAYARPETRTTFLQLLPSVIAKSYDQKDDDDDEGLRVAIELVEAVLADGFLCDEPLQNARCALGALQATLSRVDAASLAGDLETARRFYEALGSLANLADHEPLPVDFAATILRALVFGAELPDGDAARAAFRAARDLASSDALASPHSHLLFDALPQFLKPLLTTDTPANDRMDDAADAVLFFLTRLYNQHGSGSVTGLCNALALSLTAGSHATSRLASDFRLLFESAPLANPKPRKARKEFQQTFADFVSSARAYLVVVSSAS